MKPLLRKVLFGLLTVASLLPMRVLYVLGAALRVVLVHVVKYRRSVVLDNLRHSFPEKSEAEITDIAAAYYRHLSRLVVEVLKASTASRAFFARRVRYTPETEALVADWAERYPPGHTLMLLGHQGNWEWVGHAFRQHFGQPLGVVYQRLQNPAAEAFSKKMRTRFGGQVLEKHHMARGLLRFRKEGVNTAVLADQAPSLDQSEWFSFLGRTTNFIDSIGKMSALLGRPVMFVQVHAEGRGRYVVHVEPLLEQPRKEDGPAVLEAYVRHLEEAIRRQPHTWLWSHKRWKHSPPENKD